MARFSPLSGRIGSQVCIISHFNFCVYYCIVHMPRKELNNNHLKSRGKEKRVAAEKIAHAEVQRRELRAPLGN